MDHKEDTSPASAETRRDFIKKAATAAAVVASTNIFKTPVYGQNQAPSPGRVIGANDRILVGYIGVGGQGQAHVKSMKEVIGVTSLSNKDALEVEGVLPLLVRLGASIINEHESNGGIKIGGGLTERHSG